MHFCWQGLGSVAAAEAEAKSRTAAAKSGVLPGHQSEEHPYRQSLRLGRGSRNYGQRHDSQSSLKFPPTRTARAATSSSIRDHSPVNLGLTGQRDPGQPSALRSPNTMIRVQQSSELSSGVGMDEDIVLRQTQSTVELQEAPRSPRDGYNIAAGSVSSFGSDELKPRSARRSRYVLSPSILIRRSTQKQTINSETDKCLFNPH